MTAFQVPEVERFEFTMPGSEVTYSLPMIVDLAPEKLKALKGASDDPTDDPEALRALMSSGADDGDDATRLAIQRMALSQIVTLVKAWGDHARISLGELPAS